MDPILEKKTQSISSEEISRSVSHAYNILSHKEGGFMILSHGKGMEIHLSSPACFHEIVDKTLDMFAADAIMVEQATAWFLKKSAKIA